MFNNMNPALLKAKRGTMAPSGQRNPRMTMALASYKNTSAFKPTMITESYTGGGKGLLDEKEEVDDTVIGIQEEAVEDVDNEVEVNMEEQEEVSEEVSEEVDEEAADEDDYVDEEDSVAAAAAGRVRGQNANGGNKTHFKQKKAVETAAQPLEEPRKLVIGKGAVMKEHVQTQTVMLRRVSKVRGDKELTALRQETVRFTRPSMAARGVYEPQASQRTLLGGNTSYAFTATVSRVLVKEEEADNT
jgi:hypothetical protein